MLIESPNDFFALMVMISIALVPFAFVARRILHFIESRNKARVERWMEEDDWH